MPLITLTGVAKSFAGTGETVRPLDLEIPEGQFVSFLGPSGCGKSTLLRMIAGLEKPDRGVIECPLDRVSFVFQEPLLLPWRTALDNVLLPFELDRDASFASPVEAAERARAALTSVGLEDAFQKMPHHLSGGMKMRVSLARALVTKPKVLLMDEPFSALDEVTRFRLQEDLRRFWQTSRMTVIFVTHSMSEAAFLSDRQIVFSKRPATVLIDRKTRLENMRGDQTRLSPEFMAEIKDISSVLQQRVTT